MKNQDIIIVSSNGAALIFCDGKLYGDHISEFTYTNCGTQVDIRYKADELPLRGNPNIEALRTTVESILKKYEPPSKTDCGS